MESIFICDDSPDDTALLEIILQGCNFQTRIFYSGVELLSFLEITCQLPKIIILDFKIPVLSGLEIIHLIRQTEKLKYIRIILITGIDSLDMDNNGHLKIDGFMQKPCDVDKFISLVREILKN
ncbi:response regulator [Calothrix sp. FACHB-156]|nr:response regulator [Calothrix sp. FACHB-156]